MIGHPLLAVGLLLMLGWWGGRAANAIKLPRISGYLVAGMLLSPSFSNILSRRVIDEDLYIITEIALGIIAYSIGGSLVYERLKRLGKIILWIAISQAVGAFLISAAVLTLALPWLTGLHGPEYQLLSTYLPMALIIGAISVANAPGAALAIIAELRAKGPFTTTFLGVIAIGDGLAIIIFALAATAAHFLINPQAVLGLKMIGGPIAEITLSLVLGGAAGMGLKFMARLVRRREALLMVILGVLFSTSGVAILFELSPLLANMVVGFIIVNLERRQRDFFIVIEQIEETLFGLFFGLAGAYLDLGVIKSAGLLTLAIIICRFSGKQLGVWLGAYLSHAPEIIRKYLGLALFPKAGVTVGLVLVAREIFPQPLVASILVNAVIGSVIINELIAPPLVKHALLRAGEISPTSEPISQEG
ncbi:MAG: cation:proton antiporter [Desulfobacteraceae bacterium]